jgi:FlaA1/EpsC-like NDP-sugar epimerase
LETFGNVNQALGHHAPPFAGHFNQNRLRHCCGESLVATKPRARLASASEKLDIAFIGVGGQGGADLEQVAAAEEVNVVALCDVDENRRNRAGVKFPAAKHCRDYRKLLETEKFADAVVVATPDHNHAR